MSVTTTLISGDEFGRAVFAVCYSGALSLPFRFCHNASSPTSINSRIVTCFHDVEVKDNIESFLDRESMREAIRLSVSSVWQACASHPSSHLPDVIVEIGEDIHGKLAWRITHESSFQKYLDCLLPVTAVESELIQSLRSRRTHYVPIGSLTFSNVLGGRGGTTMVGLRNAIGDEVYVYKGLSFRLFVELGSGFENERNTFYHELGVVSSLPDHPNLIGPPQSLVITELPYTGTTPQDGREILVCGFLYRFLERQSLQEVIEGSNRNDERMSVVMKAKWAYQISSALAAVHSSWQYHMDLKPSNILLNEQEDTILIDWEQCGASPFFLAPEANGTWDAKFTSSSQALPAEEKEDRLTYSPYVGPLSQTHWTWPERNVFRIWQQECFSAIETAEMYSLGRTCWVIFEQVNEEDFILNSSLSEPEPPSWSSKSADIPLHWKDFISCCVEIDPNKRPRAKDAAEFWGHEMEILGT